MNSSKQTDRNISMTALFLQQSFLDSKADYHRLITSPGSIPGWDAVVITASNDRQAEGYRKQINDRQIKNRLPAGTDYIVVPDRGNARVGSAGSTLSVLRELKQRYGTFVGKRFLCIHAGGDSRRAPQYSALGKLFSPVPCMIDGVPAALFDMFMISMASIPGRMKEGMLLLSGDVILLFNPLMCDFGTGESAVISFKEDVQTGKNHGVYVRSDSGNVKQFLHKQTVEMLRAQGAVDERGNCNIDTGALQLSPALLDKLYALVDTEAKASALVNDRVRLSLYGDIAYCLAEDSTLEQFYREQPEGEFCEELTYARKQLWEILGCHSMKLLSVSPGKFVHFGSIPEIMELMDTGVLSYRPLGWEKQTNSSIHRSDVAGYNAVLSEKAAIGTGCYLEVSYVHSKAQIGNNCYLSFVDLHDARIPDDVLLHGLKQSDGKFVCRITGINDNPKNGLLFGKELEQAAAVLGLQSSDLWAENEPHLLWNARLYPECDSIREAVGAALNVYSLIEKGDTSSLSAWKAATRKSLCSGFLDADPQAVIDWNNRMEELVRMDKFAAAIRKGVPAAKTAELLRSRFLTKIQQEWLEKELNHLNLSVPEDFSCAMRLHYYLGVALEDEKETSECFRLISDTILNATLKQLRYNEDCRIITPDVTVRLPLRTNWGGGWSDTCPHCLENGGVVLNSALTLNGEYPVEVRIKRIPEEKIVFDSRDMDVHGEFTEIDSLQKTGNPFDSFALQKACLLACGVIPRSGGNLQEILHRMGGGFEMHSEVTNVPKGSGLGTSSILSAAAVKAVMEFTGLCYNDDILYSTVLAMEQIMSTGGGWQDQVGGVTPGIKFITSEPGLHQRIKVEQVNISEQTRKELSERFVLIYTGQRRLARNLLRDVVGRYIGNEPDSLTAHKEIQKSAALMRFALERGKVDDFAALLEQHWSLSKMLDRGTSNTLIEQIFLSIDDLIDARMVCGAGGGGFLQVILKKGVTKDEVHRRLKSVFQDFAVDVWPCELV